MTDRHRVLTTRLAKSSEEAWSHVTACALQHFGDRIAKSTTIAARALNSNGEVELGGLIDLKWLALEMDSNISQHPFFCGATGLCRRCGRGL